MFFLFAIILLAVTVRGEDTDTLNFPDGFKFGVATASYQIEGAWNVSDKAENVWDHFTHEKPSPISDGNDGDVACDSYHRYKEDVTILKNLGVDYYRFSLSWSRILPNGFDNKVSEDGIQYYKNLLDELEAHGIEPLVTIYHWDHPVALEEMGGWTNDLMVTWFADYARVVFREFGDRVKIFATINEPSITCLGGYGDGTKAPGKKYPGYGGYLCVHNMLKAHAKAYKIYDTEFRQRQGGQIGIVISCEFYYPKYENDTETPDIKQTFVCGWIANPIFSEQGDYPAVMKEKIAEKSQLEGYSRSRLPEFTQTEIDEIRGSSDFFGLNHYTAQLTEPIPKSDNSKRNDDSGVIISYNSSWPETAFPPFRVMPQAFGDVLRQLKTLYNNPLVYVTENGIADDGSTLDDYQRIEFLHSYLRELLIAVNRDGCNVKAYTMWSMIDNFQWEDGYAMHFGLVNVDFQDSSRKRTPKLSFKWFQQLTSSRTLPPLVNADNDT